MATVTRSWWDRLLGTTRTLFWLSLTLIVLQQLCGPSRIASTRADLLDRLQLERKSRVIAMIHRQDTVSLFGVPVSSSIGIEDSEAVLRAIRSTPPDQPEAAKELGLPVSTNVPPLIYELMDLYPQAGEGRPSVMYVPLRRPNPGFPTREGTPPALEK